MKRTAIGFAVRLAAAVLTALAVWWLFTTPFDRLPLPRRAVMLIVRVLDFPVALAGELLYPIRGAELLFPDHDTWCDFCQPAEMFRLQMRLSVPVYILLLYVPTLLRHIARRDARLLKRICIGLLIYSIFTTMFFLITGPGNRRGDLRISAMWLVILSTAAAFAWSNLSQRLKAAGVIATIAIGGWALPFLMTFIAPKMDEVQPYYVSYVVLLIFGVGGTLWLTWAVEHGIDSWKSHREVPG